MANTNGAFGLRPIGKMGQSVNSTGVSEYRIASGNTNVIYQGTPVIPLAAGVVDVVGAAAAALLVCLAFSGAANMFRLSPVKSHGQTTGLVQVRTLTSQLQHSYTMTQHSCLSLLRRI